MLKDIKEVVVKEKELPQMIKMTKSCTNGDIFMTCRGLQDVAAKNNSYITNIGEVHSWLKKMRQSLKKTAN